MDRWANASDFFLRRRATRAAHRAASAMRQCCLSSVSVMTESSPVDEGDFLGADPHPRGERIARLLARARAWGVDLTGIVDD